LGRGPGSSAWRLGRWDVEPNLAVRPRPNLPGLGREEVGRSDTRGSGRGPKSRVGTLGRWDTVSRCQPIQKTVR